MNVARTSGRERRVECAVNREVSREETVADDVEPGSRSGRAYSNVRVRRRRVDAVDTAEDERIRLSCKRLGADCSRVEEISRSKVRVITDRSVAAASGVLRTGAVPKERVLKARDRVCAGARTKERVQAAVRAGNAVSGVESEQCVVARVNV